MPVLVRVLLLLTDMNFLDIRLEDAKAKELPHLINPTMFRDQGDHHVIHRPPSLCNSVG